jgi:hypothetical protein
MATDNTPPRLRLIGTIAVILIITLVGLDFVFKSYYAYMTDEAHYEKMAPTTAREAQLATEKAAFAAARMPMDQAVASLKASRSELIEPKPSDDVGAMTGWSKLPKPAPLAAPGAPLETGAVPSDVRVDGGAAADGGATAADSGAADGGAGLPKGARAPAFKDGGASLPQH